LDACGFHNLLEDGVDDLSGWNLVFDGVEEADELLMPMLLHASSDDHAVEHIEGSEQGGCSWRL
jgi:hypothetical protein